MRHCDLNSLALSTLYSDVDKKFQTSGPEHQFYIQCEFHNMATSRDVLERCIQDICHWMSTNRLKLNPDKRELWWTGTRHNFGRLTDGGSRLVLGTEVIDASSSAWHSRQTCVWKSTLPSSVEGIFSSYASCNVYDVHSTRKRHQRSYMHSSSAGLTIATV